MTSIVTIGDDWVARLGPPRPLHFTDADQEIGLPAHVRAGSALRRWGRRIAVVQDDVNALAILDPQAGTVVSLLLPAGAGGQRQFSERRGNKAQKMDLEACFVLPDGRLIAIGSGSTTARDHVVVVSEGRHVRVVDGAPLFEHLRSRQDFAGSELNLEGAVVVGGLLRLFQRGNGAVIEGRAPSNAVGDLQLADFLSWLDDGAALPRLDAVTQVDLGRAQGVSFGFTDATALPDGRVVFLAGAEASSDTYHDGDVLGAKIGLLESDGFVACDILDTAGALTSLKLEGIDFVGCSATGGLDFMVVADMDDPDVPAAIATLHWGPP